MHKKILFLIFITVIKFSNTAQSQAIVNGYVEEKKSQEKLVAAYILAPYSKKGTVTNNYGYFSLNLTKDTATIIVSYAGFEPLQFFYDKANDTGSITFSLQKRNATEEEVIVVSNKIQKNVQQTQMSKVTIPIEQIKAMPKFLGESDVLKSLQMLPGVSQGTEGTSGIIVRGGTPDQNLILLDGTPVYNASHLFGIFSTFNTDAIKNVDLYKGGFPARFGGRLSSIIDIVLKDGDKNKFHGEGGIGLLASKIQFEGPIQKGKSSFIVSARRSYADIIAQPFIKKSTSETGVESFFAYFYDFNTKLNFDLTKKDKLFFSFYSGDDMLKIRVKESYNSSTFKLKTQVGWGNVVSTVRWNHIFSKKLFLNTIVNYTQYRFLTRLDQSEVSATTTDNFAVKYKSGIYDAGVKLNFDYNLNYKNNIKFGINAMQHVFTPGASSIKIQSNAAIDLDTAFNNIKQKSLEANVFIEDDMIITDKLKANVGIHLATFKAQTKYYYNAQPRFSARYTINANSSVKATYTRMNQYIHLLSNNATTLPTDLWVPSTDNVKPMSSNQYAIGYSKNIKNKFELSVEAYYKDMNGVIEYKDGAGFLNSSTDSWDTKVEQGKGTSYGAEFLIQKTTGRTTGWIGYTFSKTDRTFTDINFGKSFPYKYDRRHDLEITVVHKLSKKWEVSANFVLQSALPYTVAVGSYTILGNNTPYNNSFFNYGNTYDTYGGRNAVRLLPYHRMDVGFTYRKQRKRYEKTWNFSFYNVYNRLNPFYYDVQRGNNNTTSTTLNGYPLLPFLPSISWGFKF
jgi:TonB-dependent Receptor Plug Domain/CarboxypepD_reg-like domain